MGMLGLPSSQEVREMLEVKRNELYQLKREIESLEDDVLEMEMREGKVFRAVPYSERLHDS